ncbi:hypothetical protein [Varibaculum prostatecancerukia]|uniref:hypothetical protein n=1 Tax=Varibaculum prostatecancerukia TaxID=2811781 RepID=UPI001BFFE632|nr:hypothetical protein [Varibaculum prostatecancerukia]
MTEEPIDISRINKSGFNAGSDIFSEVLRPAITLASMEEDNLNGDQRKENTHDSS